MLDAPPTANAESKAVERTQAEKEARKAETARRRKNQNEKKLEDDKVRCPPLPLVASSWGRRCWLLTPGLAVVVVLLRPRHQIETVNRLLKSQSTRTRGKAPAELPSSHQTSRSSPFKASRKAQEEDGGPPRLFRTVSSVRSGTFVSSWSVPGDERYALAMEEVGRVVPGKRARVEAV